MGHSKSVKAKIDNQAVDREAYTNYINGLEADLDKQTDQLKKQMTDAITDYYKQNNWTDAEQFISGQNTDFMQVSEWSMANVKAIIDAINASIFGPPPPPKGATINKDIEGIGTAIASMTNMEAYIANVCFDVLRAIVLSFGKTDTTQYHSGFKSQPLGYGLHLFAAVVSHSYQSTTFFNNEIISTYIYMYDIRYSLSDAKREGQMDKVKLYEDQIAAFSNLEEAMLQPNNTLGIDLTTEEGMTKYTNMKALYDVQIDNASASLDVLKKDSSSNPGQGSTPPTH